MRELVETLASNLEFVIQFLGMIVAVFVLAIGYEKWMAYRKGKVRKQAFLTVRKITMIALFAVLAQILAMFSFPLPFAPSFYKFDFGDLPILIGTFAFGPVAGVFMEFCKILLNLLFNGTTTMFVGEFANFICGCSLILPASFLYEWKKSKKQALIAVIGGTVTLMIVASLLNAFYLLNAFSTLYGLPMEQLIAMGSKINPAITNLSTFVFYAVLPMNLVKGGAVSILTILIYKPLSPLIKGARS
jgi:riboflavin transporter FmnP